MNMYQASHELSSDTTPVLTFVHFIKTFLLVIYDKYSGYSIFFQCQIIKQVSIMSNFINITTSNSTKEVQYMKKM